MTPFGRLPKNAAVRRLVAAAIIMLAAWLISLSPRSTAPTRAIIDRADEFFYDTFYRLRPMASRLDGPVVIVAVDQRSLDAIDKTMQYGWPWPRELWGHITTYLANAGAKAVVYDLLFTETSAFQSRTGDDDTFAELLAGAKVPIVFGSLVSADGKWGRFAPPVKSPAFGAVNVGDDKTYRRYPPTINGQASLAVAAIRASGSQPRLSLDRSFLLHYYGPHQAKDGRRTFSHISAASVLGAQLQGEAAAKAAGITPDMFRGKIVLIGAITAGTYDLKSTPLSAEYPGVEVQATAIENLLGGQYVWKVPPGRRWVATLLCAAITTGGIVFPRRAAVKVLAPLAATAGFLGICILLFRGQGIIWLPPLPPLSAIALATLGAFAWTYYSEDRQRRFMLKALSKVVSPAVAEQLARDPERLALGTIRTEMTVLFTDLENFTALTESSDFEKLSQMLNRYLGEMSDQVLANDGTLDKYIGDAIMCFWNAPLPQADHAARACRAALAIVRREHEIQEELHAYVGKRIFTRIGINTTTVGVGFIGSDHLFNYTVLGDGVNLASRLEGTNKVYGTRILLAESTAQLVKDRFVVRKIDVVRVQGKHEPITIYEVLAERGPSEQGGQVGGGGGLEELVQGYERAFAGYQKQQWDQAQQQLLELGDRFADDGPCRTLLKRIEHLRINPPPADWDGVYDVKK